jgi:curved DNA-binding protein CbpA
MASSSQVEDFYGLLGVPDFVELECVREAYKKLALLLHPDKNPSPSATEEFQKLGLAWETLRDPVKRAEYDRAFARTKRKRSSSDEEGKHTTSQAYPNFTPRKQPRTEDTSFDEVERREKIQVFKAAACKDYISRLNVWTHFRNGHVALIANSRISLQRDEQALEEQTKEDDSDVLQKFSEAIERHRGQHRTGTLAKLIEARKKYMENLAQQITETRTRLARLLLELEEQNRLYEQGERRAREVRIREALELAGPRDLTGGKDRAINSWNALSRVNSAVNFSGSWVCKEPWHQAGEWNRAGGEFICDRCGQSAYHIIPECGPAKCPGCGMTVCNVCYRDMHLLREYEAWLTSSDRSRCSGKSMFSLDFDPSESVDPGRAPGNNFGIGKTYDNDI